MPTPVPDSVSTLLVGLDGTLVDTRLFHTVAWSLVPGDSVWDVASASGAGVSYLGIGSGGTARVDLHRAVEVVRDARALVDPRDAFGPTTVDGA